MKIVIIDTSVPISSRNIKIENSLRVAYPDAKIQIITWKREKIVYNIPDNYIVYEADAAHGNRIEKLKKIIGFAKYARKQLRAILPDIVIASHWDSLLIAPSDLPNKPILIYENLDIPTGPYLIRKATQICEFIKLRKIDLIIHASRFFKELYPKKIAQIVLENKSKISFEVGKQVIHNPFVVSYIGSVRYRETLENFIKAGCNIEGVEIKIFGNGQDLEHLKKFSSQYKNVSFYGTYAFSQIPEIYNQSDVVWAAYPNKDYNVVYAISNKFHESMACGKPCIYAKKTKLGEYVRNNKIGYIVDPYSEVEIRKLIMHIRQNINEYNSFKKNILEYNKKETNWDQDFENVVLFINNELSKRTIETIK